MLDLRTGRDTPLAELRPVDDQLAWRDDDHLLYGRGEEVLQVRADGTGRPERLLAAAGSPTVSG